MKVGLILIFSPFLLLGQVKARKFHLPPGTTSDQYASGHVIVKLKPHFKALFEGQPGGLSLNGTPIKSRPVINRKLSQKNKRRKAPRLSSSNIDIELFHEISYSGKNIEEFINQLYTSGYFEIVEPDYTVQLHYSPNDPSITGQYYLNKIKAYSAWDITKGSEEVVIGIVDSGGDLDHPDLAGQLFINVNDPVDGIDNDDDGYIDNYRGWDFMGADTLNANYPNFLGDNNPNNPNGNLGSHGSAVAGCAAAAADNGLGIAGVGFKSKLLFTKHSADNQKPSKGGIYRSYEGILYLASQGAKIINCSWGGTFRSQINQDIITYVTLDLGCLVVAAAGNDSSLQPFYPASYDYVLSVAASDQNDHRASFSNYGKTVDIIAPGKGILTTFFDNTFLAVDGTSFSAPITAGAAALVLAHHPDFTPQQLAEQLRVTADESFYDKNPSFLNNLGKGMLDITKALTQSLPSIRASNPKFVNAAGQPAEPGQEAFLFMDFTNFLSSTTAGLSVEIKPLNNAPVTLTKGKIRPGLIGTGATISNILFPFKLTINANTSSNTTVDFMINYADGEYTDYQYISFLINPSFLDIDDNKVLTTLASNGRVGFENTSSQSNGSGFVFGNNSLLFEMGLMMGTSSSNLFNNVRGINSGFDQDFLVTQKIKEIIPGERSYSEIFGTVTDNAATKSLSVSYRSLVWKEKPYDQFIILEYKIKNISTHPLPGFYFALFADWDISKDGSGDAAQWDATNDMGYVYPAQTDGMPHAGIKVLNSLTPQYFAIDNDPTIPSNPLGLYDGFTDTEKFQTMSSGIGRATAGLSTSQGNDVSHVVGAGPYDLDPDEEITVAFAVLAGLNLEELKYNASQADTAYNLMLNVSKPLTNDERICWGYPATVHASGASTLHWYKEFTGGEPFHTGDAYTTPNLFSDTVFYIANADQHYESVRSPARVWVKGNPKILTSGSGTICDGASVLLWVSEADEYLWSTGETTQSIEITNEGNYFVHVKDHTLNCDSDSEIFQAVVNPTPISDFNVEGELTVTLPVSFLNSSTGAIAYEWSFGDGATSTLVNPTHTYSTIKEYEVALTAINDFGCTHSKTRTISIITGIEDGQGFFVHPVPFSESLTIQSPWANTAWTIYDATGRACYKENSIGLTEKQIDLSQLLPGVYYLQATNGSKTITRKLIRY